MKKIKILLLILSSFGFSSSVMAKTIPNEEVVSDYYLRVKQGYTSQINRIYNMYTEEGKYYSINPMANFLSNLDYQVSKHDLDFETVNYISKVATYSDNLVVVQYLIFDSLDNYKITVYKKDDTITKELDESINNLKEKVMSNFFNLEDNIEVESNYKIENEYILDNFNITGDNILFSNQKIEFLNNLETYKVKFVPKIKCDDVSVLTTNDIKLIEVKGICDKEYEINFKSLNYENSNNLGNENNITDNNDYEDNNKEEVEDFTIKEIEVPNTGKCSILPLIIALGYCVFKK